MTLELEGNKNSERHPLCVTWMELWSIQTRSWKPSLNWLRRISYISFSFQPGYYREKSKFKILVFSHAKLKAKNLPYNSNVLQTINEERDNGRPIVLVTASPYIIAEKVAEHLDCFTEVLSSDEICNLKGKEKSALLVKKYGEQGYDYIGNSSVDLPVWATAHRALLVNCSPKVMKKAKESFGHTEVIQERKPIARLIRKQIRVHQWLKNLLIFAPLFYPIN